VPVLGAVKIVRPVGRCILTAPALRLDGLGGGTWGLCGRQPGSVAGGEFIVAAKSAFKGGDGGGPNAEVLGDSG
jgi:hypothetical protein